MDVEKLELMVRTVYMHQGDIPIDVINQYNQEIINFQLSQEGFLWCISNFHDFQSEPLILFALKTLENWIKSNWESLTEDIIGNLRQILFLQAKQTSSAFSLTQASAQFSLFQRLYPKGWPSFWEDLLSLNSNIVLNFLQQFVISIETDEGQDIKMQMQIDGSVDNVIQFVISKVEQRNNEAFLILDQMLKWIDVTPILESSVISIMQEDLNNSMGFISNYNFDKDNEDDIKLFEENINKLENVIKLLIGIVCSDIEPSILVELLNQFNIINNMMLICQNEKFQKIMASASNLISSCAHFFEDSPDAAQYYQLCLLLLSHPSVDVVEQIITFIGHFTQLSGNAEIAQNSFQALLNRLSSYLASSLLKDKLTEIDDFASSLLKEINIILSNNKGMLDDYLAAFLNSSNLSSIDPLSLAALFNILIDAFDDNMPIAKQNEIAEIFSSPLIQSLQPPYEDPVYYAVSSYMTYLSRIAGHFNPENPSNFPPIPVFQVMFESLLNNLVIVYDMDSDFKKEKFVDIASSFVKTPVFKYGINVVGEHIFGLVGTGDFDTIKIASKMLQKFDIAQRTEIFTNCMELMTASVQSEEVPNEKKQNIIKSMLLMIEQIGLNEENPEILQSIMPYMEKILPIAASYGEIMAIFIQTLYKSFGSNGLTLLLSIINDGAINDMQGLAKACEIANEYVKKSLNDVSKLTWLNDCVNKIFTIMAQLIQGVSDWADISEETKEAATLLQYFFILITQSSKFLSDELNTNLLNFTGEIFSTLFQMKSKEPICNSIKYLSSLLNSPMFQRNADSLSSTMVNNFIPLTFHIFTVEYRNMIYEVLDFHQILLKTIPQMAAQKISELFNQFPHSSDNDQAMNGYIQILHENNDNKQTLFMKVESILQYIRTVMHEQ